MTDGAGTVALHPRLRMGPDLFQNSQVEATPSNDTIERRQRATATSDGIEQWPGGRSATGNGRRRHLSRRARSEGPSTGLTVDTEGWPSGLRQRS